VRPRELMLKLDLDLWMIVDEAMTVVDVAATVC
jgi:hypothetical protein